MLLDDFQRKASYYALMLYSLIKPLLFSLSPEDAHEMTLKIAHLCPTLGKLTGFPLSPRLSFKLGHCHWKGPIGLAAGVDKNAEALEFFSHQGFGALEAGTLTLKPQIGNPKPRMFRYPDEESLRNAMGFPNQGLEVVASHLKKGSLPVGINIGKNKDSSPQESILELSSMMSALNEKVDYFVINVSSPNTPGLRALQEKSYLTELFRTLHSKRNRCDLYLKIAPDLEMNKVKELTHLSHEHGLTGLIATNTTSMPDRGVGGISGKLLTQKSRLARQWILEENLPLEVIGVGGISSSTDLFDFWKEGGKAVQIYTAYVYQGPALLKKIHQDILAFLDKHKLPNLESFFALKKEERRKLL
jgi:dihydroorotate dehydrogenase